MSTNQFFWGVKEYCFKNLNWEKIDEINNLANLNNEEFYRLARFYNVSSKDNTVISVRINTKCHYRCIHCFVGHNTCDENLIEIPYEEIIEKIESNGFHRVVLITGGEPFFHSDIKKILKYCKDTNRITSIETNIPGFDDPKKAEEYSDLVDMIVKPMYSSKKEIYESVSQVNGSYDKSLAAINNVEKYMPNTGLNFVVILIKQILSTFYDTVEFLNNNFPNSPIFTGASCLDGISFNKSISPSFPEIEEVFQKTLKDFGNKMITLYTPLCYIHPYLSLPHVGETEDSRIDGLDILDNILTHVIYDKSNYRYKPKECEDCYLYDKCFGFLEMYKDLYPNIAQHIKPITDKEYKNSNKGNCFRCNKAFTNSKFELTTSYNSYDENNNIIFKQDDLKRELCPECYESIMNKFSYIKGIDHGRD